MTDARRPGSSDLSMRLAIGAVALVLAVAVFLLRNTVSPRLQGLAGVVVFIAVVAAFSNNLRAVSWRTVGWGIAMQLGLALLILKLEIGGVRPGYVFFSKVGAAVKQFLEFTNAGSQFVFGPLANPATVEKGFGPGNGFIFAFTALPTIIFVTAYDQYAIRAFEVHACGYLLTPLSRLVQNKARVLETGPIVQASDCRGRLKPVPEGSPRRAILMETSRC